MSVPSTNLLRYVRQLAASHAIDQYTDHQLLQHFAAERDEAMFALLVRRHGSMVLSVCRRILGHEQDAEDAFQAVFLILARKAGSIRQSDVGGFLYRVAYRVAVRARARAAKQKRYEKQEKAPSSIDPLTEATWQEVRTVVDEELQRLPDDLRCAVVLCYLEGKTRREAARLLGWSEGTLHRRLERGRELLRCRLLARGLAPAAALTASLFAESGASATVPAMLASATVRAILTSKVSPAVAALAEMGLEVMSLSKTKTATALVLIMSMMTGAGLWVCLGQNAPVLAPSSSPPARKADASPPAAKDKASEKSVTIHGRVLDPDGKPAANARVYVDPQAPDEKPMASAMTGKDGRFSFQIAHSRLVEPKTKFPLRNVRILATAKGYGLDWLDVPLADAGKEVTLRLVKDDVPIQGRILSLEGKPLAGIKVNVQEIEAFPKGDLNRALQAEQSGRNIETVTDVRRIWFMADDPARMARTDAEGRFRLDGIGRERIVGLNVEGPRIHYSRIRAMTRRGKTVRDSDKRNILYGAAFEYPVRPSRLIRGTVREKGTGKVLAGIGVFALDTTAHVRTDTQGRYELPGCPKGDSYGVMASPLNGEPYFSAGVSVKDTEGLGPIAVDLEMVGGIAFEGKVVDDETGKPVTGNVSYYPLIPNPNMRGNIGLGASASERMRASGPVSGALVKADGSFRCVVLPGRGCLAFRTGRTDNAHRYARACVDPRPIGARGDLNFLMVQEGGGSRMGLYQEQFQAILLIDPAKDCRSMSKTIRLKIATELRGSVLDADGKPLSGVRVRGLEDSWGWTDTLATEKFRIHGVDPLRPRRLYFVHTTRRLIGTLEVKGTETKPLTIRLQSWAAVRGRLVDADGQPLRNAKLDADEFLPEDGRTDAEGRFRLDGLVPSRRYHFTYEKRKPSASGSLIKGFVGKPGEVRDLGDVHAKPR